MLEVKIKRELPGFTLDVAFSANQETLAILGPSGSGKSMTLRCIAGLECPDSGYIIMNGSILFDSLSKTNVIARNRKVGLVFQNYALFPHLTAGDNIAFGISDRPASEKRTIVDDLLNKMELRGLSGRYPRQLSFGQQQRVALARALAVKPDILLLDEPFSALDTPTKERLEPQVLAIRQYYEGSILLVTHDVSEAYRLCSRIAVYESGKIAQCDDKSKLITSPANLMVARLLGIKNLMSGKITAMDELFLWITLPDIGTLKVLRRKQSWLSSGMEVVIGIRPEHVKFVEHRGENCLRVIVSNVTEELNGSHYFLHGEIDQQGPFNLEAVVLSSDSSISFHPGKELYAHLPEEHITLIKREAER